MGWRIIPDFHFERDGPNLLMLSDAFVHAGSDARSTPRRANIQLVDKNTEITPSIHLIALVSDKPGTLELPAM